MGFQHRPLNANEIRLLKPLPQTSALLSFEIVHISLASKPHYTALSYTWGLPGITQEIAINGQLFPIRQNLHVALDQIKNSRLVEKYLWVDAICIDQGERIDARNERSIQITLMTQIYEQAAKVIVSLGQPENDANNRLAFSMMRHLEKKYRNTMRKGRPYRPWWWPRKPRTVDQDAADFLLNLSPATDKHIYDAPGSQTYRAWLGIIELWKSSWWTRTWIYQESTIPEKVTTMIILGIYVFPVSSKVKFMCGGEVCTWIEMSVTFLAALSILQTPSIDSGFLTGSQRLVSKLVRFRDQRVFGRLKSFLEIVQMLRHTQCVDPRDKIYAPLCLAPAEVQNYVKPDYANHTVLDVYMSVVQYSLAQPGHNLDFLGYAMYHEETQVVETPEGVESVLPSWVPNFSASLDIVPIPKLLYDPGDQQCKRRITVWDTRGVPKFAEKMIQAYRPLGDIPPRAVIEGFSLGVSGVLIDVIEDHIQNVPPDFEKGRAAARAKGRKWAMESNFKYFTGETFADALNRMLVHDLVYDSFGRPSERGGKFDKQFLDKPYTELSLTEYRYQLNMKLARSAASSLRDLGLSKTRYILSIPNTASVGDTIWALAGGQVLYILRPVNSSLKQYRFIGESYVHGLMDGDLLRRLSLGELVMKDIWLI